ncbi:hypothetical protein phytr_7450 [Candidatus Phycorickettsia trachydisci]|uniref:Tetratricopeptide repeat protein n=1 Tax=Candidatus Phycorickettsia trachydisci TaxID=2115978 RepID=A0A2P1P8U2_9RICK|nr:hypothetical protein [Candidatus Phycorickettsia trachydisci]AVP87683.1 hypothetical protein phytr_7450 [Candidatus Phycorickettsia trachydisci]
MSSSKFFTQATTNVSIFMLSAYENKIHVKNAKYFDVNTFTVSVPYRSKFLTDVYRYFEYVDIFDYSDSYRHGLVKADMHLTLSKMYLVHILRTWGKELGLLGDFIGSAQKYEEVYCLTRDYNYRAIALNALGNYKYFHADYQKAITSYKQALSFSNIDNNNKVLVANIINSLKKWGQDLFYQDKYHEAATKFLKAYQLTYGDEISDLESAVQRLFQDEKYNDAIGLNNIAFCLAKQGEEKLNIIQKTADILGSWGDRLFAKHFFKESGHKYLEAYEISHNLDYKMRFFIAKAERLSNKKLYYEALGEYNNALELAVGDVDISTIYFGKSLILRYLSENLREANSSVSCGNSKILEKLKEKEKDFINAVKAGNDQEKTELELTQALYNVEMFLYYFPDLNDYAKAADETRDLLCKTYDGELLLGEVREYKFETDS